MQVFQKAFNCITIACIGFLLSILVGCNNSVNIIYSENIDGHFYDYSYEFIKIFRKQVGYGDDYVYLRRNGNGSKMYVINDIRKEVLIISETADMRKMKAPARNSYLNDKGNFVAWMADNNSDVTFDSGLTIGLDDPRHFQVSPDGSTYIAKQQDGAFIVASTNNPEKVLVRITPKSDEGSLFPHGVFKKDEIIYLFVSIYDETKSQKGVRCKIIINTNSGYAIEREVDINLSASVVDMDPAAKTVLLHIQHDVPFHFLSSWHIYKFDSGEIKRIGRSRGIGIYLKKDVLSEVLGVSAQRAQGLLYRNNRGEREKSKGGDMARQVRI